MNGLGKEYKYDIAISLCNEDAEYARQLKVQINPSLGVFFYEQNQEEIISKSGPEVFASVFKEARVVIILCRNEWGKSFYTEIEMNSIVDRFKKEGLDFIVVVPMVPGEKPTWYPDTMIYADRTNLPIETIARIIEYRVTQSGGAVKQLTLEEEYQHLQRRIEEKKKIINLQATTDAIEEIEKEGQSIYEMVKQKMDFLSKDNPTDPNRSLWPAPNIETFFRMGDFILGIRFLKPDPRYIMYNKIVSTQDYTLVIGIHKITGHLNNLYEESENKKSVKMQSYKYVYGPNIKGWATPFVHSKNLTVADRKVLFYYKDPVRMQETYYHYDLKDPLNSVVLIDQWYKELLKYAASSIKNYV